MKKLIFTAGLSLMMATGYSVELSTVDEAKFNAAVKAYRMNQSAKALSLFTELYTAYPQNQQIKNNYAVVLFGSGKLEKAEEVLSSVIESNKEVNVAYKNLNKIYDYAAAKAYSNALGTEKEVTPQKLQIIEALAPPTASVALAANQSLKSVPSALENAMDQKPPAAQLAKNTPVAPIGTKVLPDTMSKADVNSYLVSALSDAAEPIGSPSAATPPVLNASDTNVASSISVAISEPAAKTKPATKDTIDATASPSTASDVAAVESAINNWAQAWSKGDAESYITYYEPTFKLGKMSHNQWIANRKQHISPAENIQVKLSNIVVTPSKTDDTIIAYFKQNYHAKQYQDNTSKQLVWKKVGEKWFIKKEIKMD
ncbi:MAG: tetratricopeptide repeat protein [Methylococcaceae bacterium]